MKNKQSIAEVWVRTRNRTLVPIDDWEALHLYFADNKTEVNFIFGKFIISQKEEKAIVMKDRLEPLAQNLCLYGAKKLLTNKDYNFRIWDYDWTVSLKIEGDDVIIGGEHFTPTAFSQQKLIASLLECAAKVMALMQKIHTHYPEYNCSAYAYFEELYAECQILYKDKYGKKS